jgi:D-alanyl-D-alanine carboxypeptidase/D-alanyl-D-alanine-endopeptidase (penicillin-binding protein 4)
MNGTSRVFISLLALAASQVISPAGAPGEDLQEQVAAIMKRPLFKGSSFGILVTELETGKVVYAHRPLALLAPASTTKLVSCGGALGILGKDFRFRTNVVRTGDLEDGSVNGDLVLVASGDPNLSQRPAGKGRLRFVDRDHSYAGFSEADLVPGDPLKVLREMARNIAARGVKEVKGDIVVDDGLFKETSDSFVGDFSAICINDNLVDFVISPGAQPGEKARASWQPSLDPVKVRIEARTVGKDGVRRLWVESLAGPASFVVKGTIPAGSSPTVRVGRFKNPALAAAHLFAAILEKEGIRIKGEAQQASFGPALYMDYEVVARHISAPFSEAVRVCLKVSHNLHATMFPVLVGALHGKRGDRLTGYGKIREFFARGGLAVDTVLLQSGSGGGRADSLSSRFLVDLLQFMAGREDFPQFFDALPIGGIDGTISSRFKNSPLWGRVRAKTGTLVYKGSFNNQWIYLSKALAGYIDLRTDKRPNDMLCFAILIANTVNQDRSRTVKELFGAQEDILEAVTSHWRKDAGALPKKP